MLEDELDKVINYKETKNVEKPKDIYWEYRLESLKSVWDNPQVDDFTRWVELKRYMYDLLHDNKISSDAVTRFKNREEEIHTSYRNIQTELINFYKKQYDKLVVLEL